MSRYVREAKKKHNENDCQIKLNDEHLNAIESLSLLLFWSRHLSIKARFWHAGQTSWVERG